MVISIQGLRKQQVDMEAAEQARELEIAREKARQEERMRIKAQHFSAKSQPFRIKPPISESSGGMPFQYDWGDKPVSNKGPARFASFLYD